MIRGVTVMDPEVITYRDDEGLATFEWTRVLQEVCLAGEVP